MFNDASELDWSIFYWIGRDSTVNEVTFWYVWLFANSMIKLRTTKWFKSTSCYVVSAYNYLSVSVFYCPSNMIQYIILTRL